MIKYYPDLIQGSDEWLSARLGLLTASEMKLIVTPGTMKPASNEKERAHMYELLAQRITNYVEPHYVGDDMLRGMADEVEARILYDKNYERVTDCGFITNDKWGFTLGYSPDGLVGDDGAIECKSRRQKFQIETILNGKMPDEYTMQVQTGLLISERKWIDFISYSAGIPMVTLRIYPEEKIQEAIINAATAFNQRLDVLLDNYNTQIESKLLNLITTERKMEQEITL